MNPCVKTGVIFRDDASGRVHTGDLFYGWQIRGIPLHNGDPAPRLARVDIVIAGAEYYKLAGRRYAATEAGLRIKAYSPEFERHLREWYPELCDLLTAGR